MIESIKILTGQEQMKMAHMFKDVRGFSIYMCYF